VCVCVCDTIQACDKWADGQTHDDSTYHASIASHGKNADFNLARWRKQIGIIDDYDECSG